MGCRRSLLAVLAVLCASAVMAPTALAAPTATTGDADQITQYQARVHGTVSDPALRAVNWYFEYGTTAGYGSQTTTFNFTGEGGSVQRILEQLTPGTLYHYRVVATDQDGDSTQGEDRMFTTLALPNRDGDAYPDNQDSCPDTPGGAQGQYNAPGCPAPGDSDGDGYIDPEDSCPSQFGGAQGSWNQRGCPPPPDSDGDGYIDPEDRCPTKPGGTTSPANDPSCPPPGDADGDGFPDYFGPPNGDECPDKPGPGPTRYNDSRRGCPERDDDKDGVPNHRDACPVSDQVNASKDVDERGCPPFRIGASIHKTDPPTVKAFVKSGLSHNIFFGEGPRVVGKPFMRVKATMSLTPATADRLNLKSPVVDSWSGQSPKASQDPEGGGRYVFPQFNVPSALKRKLAKLNRIPVTIKYVATDAYDKKHLYRGAAVIGSTGCRAKTPSKCPSFTRGS
jgi:hypothetical protein